MFSTRSKILLLILIIAVASGIFIFTGKNLHTVIKEQYYRSAQLNKHDLAEVIKKNHIKSIVNLRGSWLDNTWYQNEVHIAAKNNVQLYSVRLPSKGLPYIDRFKKMVNALSQAEPPVLIHCKNGADRSGLASAIILILNQNMPLEIAKEQINWKYGVISSNTVGNVILPIYEKWLHDNTLLHNRENFLYWSKHLKSWEQTVPVLSS